MPPSFRIAYLTIPHLPVAVERRERARLAGLPVIIAGAGQGASRVVDCSPEVLDHGVGPGMPVSQAERLCPQAIFLSSRPDLYGAVAANLFDLLSSQVAAAEQAQPGGIYLSLAGLENQDDEALALCRQLGEETARQLGLSSAAGVAANKFTAEAASLSIGLNRALVLTAGTERSFLSDFPIALLPVSDEARRRLHLFGLKRLGQFAGLPPAAVLAQFGWEGKRAHRLARGQDDRPLIAGKGERSEMAACQFDPPLDNLETLVAAAGRLVAELGVRLDATFQRSGQLDLAVDCVDGSQLTASRILAQPTADGQRLARLAEVLLQPLPYADRVSELTITLSRLGAPSLHQLSLWHNPQQADAEAHLARLVVRYGPTSFRRAMLVDPDHRLAGRRFVMISDE